MMTELELYQLKKYIKLRKVCVRLSKMFETNIDTEMYPMCI